MFEIIIIGAVIFLIASNQNRKINNLENKLDNYFKNYEQKINTQIISAVQSPTATPTLSVSEELVPEKTTEVGDSQTIEQRGNGEESSGKILGRIGIGALILGVSFFLKYAFDNNWVSPAGRVLVGVLIGVILISLGQYFRKKYDIFSEIMFGGGITVLYLSFYSAHHFYNLIDPLNTGILMILVTTLTFIFSLINKDSKLAILAVIGGFLTPFIIGASGNNMLEVFAYLVILNSGVLAITILKKWPNIVALAIVGTAINFFAWYFPHYIETNLMPTVFFLIISSSIFFIGIMYKIVISKVKSNEFDYFLLMVNDFGFYLIFYNIMKPMHENMIGFYTLIIGILYLLVAYITNKENNEDKALNIFIPGMAVAFISLSIPVQFSGLFIAIFWFIEACVLYFIASSINNRGFQFMGLCVYSLGLINLFGWNLVNNNLASFVPFMNKTFSILVVGTISAYVISYIYYKYGSISSEIQKRGITLFIIVANILTLYALSTQIIFFYNSQNIILENNFAKTTQILIGGNKDNYNYNVYGDRTSMLREEMNANKNKSNTTVSILWAIFAAIFTAVGFIKRSSFMRILGLTLFIITSIKILFDVWSLGSLYRIISFVGLGVITLIASFIYAKYKDRLNVA